MGSADSDIDAGRAYPAVSRHGDFPLALCVVLGRKGSLPYWSPEPETTVLDACRQGQSRRPVRDRSLHL
jgi:hypothetical protein